MLEALPTLLPVHSSQPVRTSLGAPIDSFALSRYGVTATRVGTAQNAFPVVQWALRLPRGSWSCSGAEPSLLLAAPLFGRAKKWGISGEERRKTQDLHFNSSLVRFCYCIVLLSPSLYFPIKWGLILSACGNTGEKIPYRQEIQTEEAAFSSLLLSKMERRPPQIPSYLIPCSMFSGTPRQNHKNNSYWRCLPDANGHTFARLLCKHIQITHLGPGKGLWANQRV